MTCKATAVASAQKVCPVVPAAKEWRLTRQGSDALNPIRILLADDEVDFLDSLAKVLRRRGIEVEKARDGREALAAFDRNEFNVIVLDLRMPVLDGIATLKEIRKTDLLTPVLLLSGHADLAFVTEALRGGAADYMLKPCPVESLVAAIENACERKAIAQEVAEKTKGS